MSNKNLSWFKPLFIITIILLAIFSLTKISNSSTKVFTMLGETYSTNDINQYGNFENHIHGEKNGIYSQLNIFPTTIPSSANAPKYFYYATNKSIFDNDYQIFLECTLSAADYESELQRISELNVVYDKTKFILPSYVIDPSNSRHEYALFDDENNKIIYIFTQFVSRKDIRFDKKYLPENFAF